MIAIATALLLDTLAGAAWSVQPTVRAGYASVVSPHVSLALGARVSAGAFYVQPEYLWLAGSEHVDAGPAIAGGACISRVCAGVGGGPVRGLAGDDGLRYAAVSATLQRARVTWLPEVRLGLLGETRYVDVGVVVRVRLR